MLRVLFICISLWNREVAAARTDEVVDPGYDCGYENCCDDRHFVDLVKYCVVMGQRPELRQGRSWLIAMRRLFAAGEDEYVSKHQVHCHPTPNQCENLTPGYREKCRDTVTCPDVVVNA